MQNKELIGQHNIENIKRPEMVDVGAESRNNISSEVKDWMQKIEENNTQSDLISDIYSQKTSDDKEIQKDLLKIPVTKHVFKEGFKMKFNDSGRWLSEFFLRLIKIKKGKVEFTENDN